MNIYYKGIKIFRVMRGGKTRYKVDGINKLFNTRRAAQQCIDEMQFEFDSELRYAQEEVWKEKKDA